MRTALSLVVVLGCGAGAEGGGGAREPATPPAAPARVRDPAVPEPYRPPPERFSPEAQRDPAGARGLRVPLQGPRIERAVPREQVVLDHVAGRPRRLEPAETDISESELWEPCVRDFVRGLAEPARRALTAALARYRTACTPDGRVALLGARGLDGREYRGRSDVAVIGKLSAARTEVSLRISYCGGPLAADRAVISAGGERWTSSRLVFSQDEYGCEVALLPWSRGLARALGVAVSAPSASIALEGRAPQDLAVTEEMRPHLGAILDALDALDGR